MKTITFKLLVLPVLLAFLATGCSLDDPESSTNLRAPAGSEFFKNYVSVGNSLTAGFMDGGLMLEGQGGSYPSLLAGQIGFGDLTQPWVAPPGIGGITAEGLVTGVLYVTESGGLSVLGTTPVADVATLAIAQAQPTPYHNLAVPAATVNDMFNTVESMANPFFTLINRVTLSGHTTKEAVVLDIDGATPTDVTYETASLGWQSIAKSPTLVTYWAGANDVLGWATRGGDQSPVPITDPAAFASSYFTSLQLLAGGLIETTGFPAAILTANLPYITDAPYFLPRATFDAMVAAQIGVPWPAEYEDDMSDPEALVRFPTLNWIVGGADGNSPPDPATDPIPANYTLTGAEVATANGAVDAFNSAIAAYSAAVNGSGAATVAMVDMNTLMADIANPAGSFGPFAGQHFLVLALNPATAPNALDTLFSLDGLHPNHKGYGVVANAFIGKINEALETSVADVDWESLVWDPTYADYQPEPEPASTALVSPAAARAMDAVYR